ncbi:MAG: DUF5685 family protein, partial [Bacillota bacterium]|nr:DUF5685 family protein [Bacillota bacterium]
DVQDEGKKSAKALLPLVRPIHKKLLRKYPTLCEGIELNLAKLNILERDKCDSLDQVAEAFAKIMEVIFYEGASVLQPIAKAEVPSEILQEDVINLHHSYAKIGYHMGKWIYLMDAIDDIEENVENGAYNPLLYRFRYEADETVPEFRERIRNSLEFNLYQYLAVISETLDRVDMKKNSGIINNIIYFGLNRKTEDILNKDLSHEENENGSL